jgi:hypothetical protein
MPDEPDLIKGSEEAYRQVRQAQLDRARANDTPEDASPDTAASMGALFRKQEDAAQTAAVHYNAAINLQNYVQQQREYFDDKSDAMSLKGMLERGGERKGGVVRVSDGLAGMLAAGGERKGGMVKVSDGLAGMLAAGGQKTGPELKIGASFKEQLEAVRWGARMQALRIAGREYASQRKIKNDGGLSAARQPYAGVNFFGHRSQFTRGAVTFTPMDFSNGVPIVGVHKAVEDGWAPVGAGYSAAMKRALLQMGRNYRSTLPLYGNSY